MSALATLQVAASGWQPNWFDVIRTDFMRNAFLAGTLLAIASGLLGYFVVVRGSAFAAHALAHIGFPGATGAILLGLPVVLGLAVFCIGGGLTIGFLGKRAENREVATGTVLAFATGLGVLFSSLTTKNSNAMTNVLFGNLLAVSSGDLVTFALFTMALLLVVAVVARPLTFASVDPRVAEAKGVPVGALSVLFMVLLALVVTMAVQVVGTLLLFALVVTPCATGLVFAARPLTVGLLGTAIALVSVWCGLVLSAMFNLPPSFFIVTIAFVIWLVGLVFQHRQHRVQPAGTDVVIHPPTP